MVKVQTAQVVETARLDRAVRMEQLGRGLAVVMVAVVPVVLVARTLVMPDLRES